MSWCTVESDPGVFTELIAQIGVKGVQVEELYGLDLAVLKSLSPVHGLIFLFKWQSGVSAQPHYADDAPVYFAKQMINNACGTQAIINILLNCSNLDLGDELTNFKEFTRDLPSDMRGEAIGNSELIRKAHNSFARPEPFIFDEKKEEGDEDDDAFHFVGYVPINGTLYELDGLARAPIAIMPCANEHWLEAATEAIQAKIQLYASKEIRFNLMAIIGNRQDSYMRELASLDAQLSGLSSSDAAYATLQLKKQEVERALEDEKIKFDRWKIENARRKHNYVPFIFNLLKMLAEKGRLNGLVESAAKSSAERVARSKAAAEERKRKAQAAAANEAEQKKVAK